jgi:putative zinc finger/helix-turn-helix YgiT family protein
MSIRCLECDAADLEPKMIQLTGQVKGETYTVTTPGLECPNCGYKAIEGPDSAEFSRRLADAYRAANGLLTSEQIRERRRRLGMSQEEFANFLPAGIASVKRWEWGKIQDRHSDALIRERTDQPAGFSTTQYAFANFDSTAMFNLVGLNIVRVAITDPDPASRYFTAVLGYIRIAMSDAEFKCTNCSQTGMDWAILGSLDQQITPQRLMPFLVDKERRSRVRH